jgi:hypothetical protein
MATEQDIKTMVQIGAMAFYDSPVSAVLFPERLRIQPGNLDELDYRRARILKAFPDPDSRHIIALVDTGSEDGQQDAIEEIAGFAIWKTPTASKQEVEAVDGEKKNDELPPYMDKEVMSKLEAQLKTFETSACGSEVEANEYWSEYIYLQVQARLEWME